MSADIIDINTKTIGPGIVIDPDRVLDAAKGHKQVFIVSVDQDDQVRIFGSHSAPESLWLMEKAKLLLLSGSHQ